MVAGKFIHSGNYYKTLYNFLPLFCRENDIKQTKMYINKDYIENNRYKDQR